jgi:hypothetical protein
MRRVSTENLIFFILALCLTAYTFTRAAVISITHDEVGTYLGYSIGTVMDIIRFTNLQLNNHVLNSLLVKLTTWIFGVSEFSIRLPNLIAHLLFLYFSWKILRLLTKDKFLMIAGFILINFNPYLLDFFSIARGYGLEISMMAMSIYFLLQFQLKKKPVFLWLFICLSALGVLSNFTFITVYISMIILVNLLVIIELAEAKKSLKLSFISMVKLNLPVFIISVCLAVLIIGPVTRLESLGEFSARANEEGFWANLFRSVIRHSLYGQFEGSSLQFILTVVFQVLTALFFLLFSYLIYRDKWNAARSGFFVMVCLLFVICLWFYIQHILLGSRYPQQRTALFILPLFIFTLVAFLDSLTSHRQVLIPIRTLMVIVSVFVLYHFYTAASTSHYLDWKYDADTKHMLAENLALMKSVAPATERKVNFGTYWLYKPGLDFYLRLNKINWIRLVTYRDSFTEPADFYYIPPEFKDSLNKFYPVKLKDYPLSGSVLYKQNGEGISR